MHFKTTQTALLIVAVAVVGGVVANYADVRQTNQETIYADVPVGTAKLSTSPETQTVKVGDTFSVDVVVNTVGKLTSGIDLYLQFDPAILEVVDADTATEGIQVTNAGFLPVVPANEVVSATGQINFSVSQQPTGPAASADAAKVATIQFRAKAAGSSAIAYEFTPGSVSDTNVIDPADGRDLLSSVVEGVVTVTE